MFAVPGWSVESRTLKTQTVGSIPAKTTSAATDDNEEGSKKANKKRKRGKHADDVNSSNVAELYETVIEGRPKVDNSGEKRQKISKDGAAEETEAVVPKVKGVKQEKKKKEKTLKDKKREKKLREQSGETPVDKTKPAESKKAAKEVPVAAPAPTLTPLQASMRQKLISARFRHLNQTLYTTPSAHSLSLFSENPEMFTEYHEGFRRQVEVWPENPVDGYIRIIKARGKVRGPVRKGEAEVAPAAVTLPRTEGTCHIADLGCGDAALSAALQKDCKKLGLKIHSFDLYSPHPLVTKADIADLPLKDGSVDIAIFCLALMGTNWIDFIEEAFRILRWKGELWIAEIKSRFGRVGKGGRVEHSVGNRQRKLQSPSKKEKQKAEDEAAKGHDTALMVEVDGNDDMKVETDVSAFVEVLRKRGFLLKGEDARGEKPIDLSNKMFVRMHFVKSQTPLKGKCVPVPEGMSEMGLETWKSKKPKKFLEAEGDKGDVPISSEAAVLKPCVYKLR
ncbi:hypothetical protein HYALB_00009786 [Hymenoscyphus albidus]|uniref:Ribosomal RNA-processing protein 8 n=1 Tax=Hymenoscyphus albidus TaxID=595503 RepID=A0A9N9LQU8_9HELO|nr:hypothetical protein HYALB_00009786 [Hymenoscyphus albidus]